MLSRRRERPVRYIVSTVRNKIGSTVRVLVIITGVLFVCLGGGVSGSMCGGQRGGRVLSVISYHGTWGIGFGLVFCVCFRLLQERREAVNSFLGAKEFFHVDVSAFIE